MSDKKIEISREIDELIANLVSEILHEVKNELIKTGDVTGMISGLHTLKINMKKQIEQKTNHVCDESCEDDEYLNLLEFSVNSDGKMRLRSTKLLIDFFEDGTAEKFLDKMSESFEIYSKQFCKKKYKE